MIHTPRKNNASPTDSERHPQAFSLRDIAALVGGELVGDPGAMVTGVAGIQEAAPGEITFLSNSKYLPCLDQTRATAVIASRDVVSSRAALIRTDDPSRAFTRVISLFCDDRSARVPGIDASAVVHPSAVLGSGVHVGPLAVVEEGVRIGDGTVIEALAFVGARTVIGKNSRLYPHVTVREDTRIGERVILHSGTVIGADGFGYETVDGVHVKIPQKGHVEIEDDVEIGANVCVDRARFGKTWIKRGTKIDNLVQIAHNVVVGEHSIIVSQAGISGSTRVGNRVVIAGQAGIIGHVELGDDVVVGARAGVTKSFPEKTVVLGSPARPIAEQKKIFALIARLPELFREMAALRKKCDK